MCSRQPRRSATLDRDTKAGPVRATPVHPRTIRADVGQLTVTAHIIPSSMPPPHGSFLALSMRMHVAAGRRHALGPSRIVLNGNGAHCPMGRRVIRQISDRDRIGFGGDHRRHKLRGPPPSDGARSFTTRFASPEGRLLSPTFLLCIGTCPGNPGSVAGTETSASASPLSCFSRRAG